ncbi:MFS transporter [Candidatus Woesearchaeota archaeon]|nr:MFS transporter [Candidatus Woesearchaeota archaeon]
MASTLRKSIDLGSNLRASTLEGIFGAAMSGLTTSFVAPLAIAMGAGASSIALLASLPGLVGSWAQIGATHILDFIPDRRRVIITSSLAQALVWMPLAILPFMTSRIPLLIAFVCLHAMLANLYQPLFTSLIGDIVPQDKRGYFFARRNKYITLVTFLAMLTAGTILTDLEGFIGFAIIFGSAAIAQLISTYFKARLDNPPQTQTTGAAFGIIDFLTKGRSTDFGRFVLFVSLLKFSVNIAAPFLAIYMLTTLGLDYLTFTIILSSSVIFKYLTMDIWGSIIDRAGNRRVMLATSTFVPAIALGWTILINPWQLFIIEALSGIAWAGLDLAINTYIFDCVSPKNRIRCSAYYNAIVGKATFLGASLGGIIIAYLPDLGLGIPIAFLASAIASAGSLTLLRGIREMRLVSIKEGTSFFFDDDILISPKRSPPLEIIPTRRPKHHEGPLLTHPTIITRRIIQPSPYGTEYEQQFVTRLMRGVKDNNNASKVDALFTRLHKGRM